MKARAMMSDVLCSLLHFYVDWSKSDSLGG